MAPKKKAGKKGQDDWEADLGEPIAPPVAGDDAAAADADANGDDADAEGGGLMAMLRKNKEKRKKKGLPEEEPVPDEPPADDATKAPEEANLDDEFALPEKKGKGVKGKPHPGKKEAPEEEEFGENGKILTKAEKEKAKKEREKQRKKEQACRPDVPGTCKRHILTVAL